jgi:hypothetical protein
VEKLLMLLFMLLFPTASDHACYSILNQNRRQLFKKYQTKSGPLNSGCMEGVVNSGDDQSQETEILISLTKSQGSSCLNHHRKQLHAPAHPPGSPGPRFDDPALSSWVINAGSAVPFFRISGTGPHPVVCPTSNRVIGDAHENSRLRVIPFKIW